MFSTLQIGLAKFDNKTYKENKLWKKKKDWEGAVYGFQYNIPECIPYNSYLYIIHSDLRESNLKIFVLFVKFLVKHFLSSYHFFWGYQRSLNYYSQLLCNEGFSLKKTIKLDHQSLMIFKKN